MALSALGPCPSRYYLSGAPPMGLVFWKDYSPGATEKEAMQRRSREPGRQVAEKQLARSSSQQMAVRESVRASCWTSSSDGMNLRKEASRL